MKKHLIWVSILLLLVTLTACGTSEQLNRWYTGTTLNPDTEIVMKTVYPVYDAGCEYVSIVIENRSDEQIEFGAGWEIERIGALGKTKFLDSGGHIDILYILDPGGKRYANCSVLHLSEKLKNGRYRILKEINGDWYSAEFEIGDSPITAQTPHGFPALEDLPQGYSPEDAAADGVVVLRDGETVNGEIMTAFFNDWNVFGFRGQLRVMSETDGGWLLTDILRENDQNRITCRTADLRDGTAGEVTTAYYSFFHQDSGVMYLSNHREFGEHEENLPLFGGIALPQEIVAATEPYRGTDSATILEVWSPDGKIRAAFTSEWGLSLGTTGWGTYYGGKHANMKILTLVWADSSTLMVMAENSDEGLPYFYEFIHIDAADMKSIQTVSYTASAYRYEIHDGKIIIPE